MDIVNDLMWNLCSQLDQDLEVPTETKKDDEEPLVTKDISRHHLSPRADDYVNKETFFILYKRLAWH